MVTGHKHLKKSHTCEEGEAHLRISVWHLLINLKNNYLFKKLLNWANRKCEYFNIYKNKKQIIKKQRKTPGDIITVCLCTNNLHDMIYSFWDTECDRLKAVINYGSFFAILPSPLKTQKIRILKKWKKLLETSSFYTSVPKTTIIWGTSPEIRCVTDLIFCHFGPFFATLPSSP